MDFPTYNGSRLFHLEKNIYAYVSSFDGKVYVHIRAFTTTSRCLPTLRGIAFSLGGFDELLRHSNNIIVDGTSSRLCLSPNDPQDPNAWIDKRVLPSDPNPPTRVQTDAMNTSNLIELGSNVN